MTTKNGTLVTVTCQVLLMVTRARLDGVSELPTWYPGSENKMAPMPLLRVQGFVNTRDLEEGTDLLADLASGRDWLREAGLLGGGAELTESDLEFTLAVREAMRTLIGVDGGDAQTDRDRLEPLRRLAAHHRSQLTVNDDGTVRLENCRHETLDDSLFELLLIVHRAQEDGSWSRLKLCANPDCEWAFFDHSRNQQGSWCDMAVCGNRLKNREFRARRR
jgi:predicted RNA-binding Zn ribbon-like protein